MDNPFGIAALWFGLALIATFVASSLRVSSALTEILVGIVAAAGITAWFGPDTMGGNLPWLKFLAGIGAVLLTFLAGAELEPSVMRRKWQEVTVVGLVGFIAPFLGCTAVARYLLHWSPSASWLGGIALSTTSMAVVYAVMLETGFNRTEFGKGILGACFVNDLGTVLALGLLFAPFTWRTVVFALATVLACALLPVVTTRLANRYANRTAAFRTKWVLFMLFGLGALALWAGSEPVLPAYIIGMVLASTLGSDHAFIRRLRTLTVGFLTPIYFLRAGSFVSLPALAAAPLVFFALLGGKVGAKIFGLFPFVARFRHDTNERWYYTLMMSTGLTFGTIASLYGLTHGIVTQAQYSHLVAVVIGSAVVPTLVAGAMFLPKHLIPRDDRDGSRPAIRMVPAEASRDRSLELS
ncbi:MAG TPA: cation:proton antiporter [Candidatus Baltobacteraceae bacterium]|nr:cation:proton antiporter [Candidatus Baltobacteraceae bacterium]